MQQLKAAITIFLRSPREFFNVWFCIRWNRKNGRRAARLIKECTKNVKKLDDSLKTLHHWIGLTNEEMVKWNELMSCIKDKTE